MNRFAFIFIALLIAGGCTQPNAPTKYRYDSKKLDLPYTDWKKDRSSAEARAAKELDFYAKDACRRMGYGWALDKIVNKGELNCEETPEGHHCRMKNVELKCRQRDER